MTTSTYIPKFFNSTNVELMHETIQKFPFALIVTGTHLTWAPIRLEPNIGNLGLLQFHLARANPHTALLEKGNQDTTIVFLGSHGYISPRWYQDRKKTFPTWNFVAYHVKGKPSSITNIDEMKTLIGNLTDEHEKTIPSGNKWSINEMDPAFLNGVTKGLVGFNMPITDFEGKRKLSQNRSEEDQIGMILGLSGGPNSQLSLEMNRERKSFL
jgi:transcriptional regulator